MKFFTSLSLSAFCLMAGAQNVTLIQDVNTRVMEYNAEDFCEFNNQLFFSAESDVYGRELFVYDPSQAIGSQVNLVESTPDPSANIGNPEGMIVYNGDMYMNYTDALNGTELFKYDGLSVQLVADMETGTAGSHPQHFIKYNGKLYMTAEVAGERELYEFDGTNYNVLTNFASGNPGFNSFINSEFEVTDGILYFSVKTLTNDNQIYKYDGVNAPALVHTSTTGIYRDLTAFNDTLYFAWNDGNTGIELYKYGANGVELVYELNSGGDDSFVDDLIVVNDTLYFTAMDFNTFITYTFYATPSESVTTVNNVYEGGNLFEYNNKLHLLGTDFSNNGLFSVSNGNAAVEYNYSTNDYTFTGVPAFFLFQNELYSTGAFTSNNYVDSEVAKISVNYVVESIDDFKSIQTQTNDHAHSFLNKDFLVHNGKFFYLGSTNDDSQELYQLTTDTIVRLSYNEYDVAQEMVTFNNDLYFAHSQSPGNQPGVSSYDGNQITQEISLQFRPQRLTVYNNELYLYAHAGSGIGEELCKLDNGSLTVIADLEAGPGSSGISQTIVFNGQLWFFTNFGTYDDYWHYYDGNQVNQVPLNDYGSASSPHIFKNELYFLASETTNPLNFGRLWATPDGNTAPEIQYPHITHVKDMLSLNDSLYFFGESSGQLYLYREDALGNLDSVFLNSISNPAKIALLDEVIYFAAQGANGRELYAGNMVSGFTLFEDIYQGAAGSVPGSLAVYSDTLFFHGETESYGREWYYTMGCQLQAAISENNGVLEADINGATYQWVDCSTDQMINQATSQTFVPVSPGSYACIITLNGCTDRSDCITVNPNSIEDLVNDDIKLYPNPADNMVFIKSENEVRSYQILSQQGSIVGKGAGRVVNVTDLAVGMYLLRIETEHQVSIMSLIKR